MDDIDLKVAVGEQTCLIEDGEVGCSPYEAECPANDIVVDISCKHQNHNYIALKCEYDGCCDFAREVEHSDFLEYPELFKEEEEDDE